MANSEHSNSSVPVFDCTNQVRRPGSLEVDALQRFYRELTFIRFEFKGASTCRLLQPRCDDDLVECCFSVRGAARDLLRYRFMHPDWVDLPACGVRHHRTADFGRATVNLLKSEELSLSYARLEHEMDLVAPALLALHWKPNVLRGDAYEQ